MFSKSEIKKSLVSQGLVDDPESWMKLAALIACVATPKKALAKAVNDCYQKVR